MKFECPICRSTLEHEREDDGIIRNAISKSGEVIEVYNDSKGGDRVYCSHDSKHPLPQELIKAVLDLVNYIW
jgi:hypothetical protein